ncbi:MAG: SMP-30/gluconolactonase/LRE family protein [Planktomarina sp.]
MTICVFDGRNCSLGEGPLWHPKRGQLFWFDINAKKMLSRVNGQSLEWQFDRHVSAAGWACENELLVASETELFLFNVETENTQHLCDMEADKRYTRSNDGRADPWGGFWIGTMGKSAQPHEGAIYRYYQGKLTRLFDNLTIPNSICFAPDKSCAYFADTPTRQIMRQSLDNEGWPIGAAEVFVDLSAESHNPDGSVVDCDGNLWNAQWGSSRVACYDPRGVFQTAVDFPALQVSCPAFGGADGRTLFVTSAFENMDSPSPEQGKTYCASMNVQGQIEHRVKL